GQAYTVQVAVDAIGIVQSPAIVGGGAGQPNGDAAVPCGGGEFDVGNRGSSAQGGGILRRRPDCRRGMLSGFGVSASGPAQIEQQSRSYHRQRQPRVEQAPRSAATVVLLGGFEETYLGHL